MSARGQGRAGANQAVVLREFLQFISVHVVVGELSVKSSARQ